MFEQTFLIATSGWRRMWSMAASASGQVLAIGMALLVPLLFPEALPVLRATAGLFEPPAPPPPPRPVKVVSAVRSARAVSQVAGRILLEPRSMPARPAMLTDGGLPAPLANVGGEGEGVPGGIGGGDAQASLLGRLGHGRALPPPPPPKPEPTPAPAQPIQRIYQGGNVLQGKLIHIVKPAYPPLARAGRVSGTVRLEAIVGKDGRVRALRLISGHPLLAQAAIDAVRQWVYRPTLLNGEPVEVAAPVDVNFLLE